MSSNLFCAGWFLLENRSKFYISALLMLHMGGSTPKPSVDDSLQPEQGDSSKSVLEASCTQAWSHSFDVSSFMWSHVWRLVSGTHA